MATLLVEGDQLLLHLSRAERLGALHGDIRIPLGAVTDVRVSDDPWGELRGLRAPGTGWPRVIALGTWRGAGFRDFVAVYRRRGGVVVTLAGTPFDRLVVSVADPSGQVQRIADARRSGAGAR